MRSYLIAFGLIAALSVSANSDEFSDAITQKAGKDKFDTKIALTGIELPKGYEIGNFSYSNSFAGGQCLNFTLSPETENTTKVFEQNLRKYLKANVTIAMPVAKDKSLKYSGIISDISYQAKSGEYSVSACDELKLLSLGSENEMFMNKSRIDAIKATLDEHKINYKFELKDQYPVVEFTTRYAETDLNFVNRLLEENGIYYIIKPIEGKDTYIFVDNLEGLNKYTKEVDYKSLNEKDKAAACCDSNSLSIQNSIHFDNYQMSDYDLLSDKLITESANTEVGKNTQKEYQITDYPSASLKKVAEVKLAALNSETNSILIDTSNPDVSLGDRIKIGNRTYYVTSLSLSTSCEKEEVCKAYNYLTLIPSDIKFANKILTPSMMNNSTLVGFVSDPVKDSKGRIGFRFPWMASQPADVMYRALLSGSAQKLEYKAGEKVLINFISGFPDRPIIIDKL